MITKDLPKLPQGFEWVSVQHLKQGQFFFFNRRGLRLRVFVIRKNINSYKIIATKPNGINLTRNVSEMRYLITYS